MQIWNGSDEYCWRYRADTILSTDGQPDSRTDGRTDGQTDKVIPVYPPFNFVEAGGIITMGQIQYKDGSLPVSYIENLIIHIRRSNDCLFIIMGFLILVRRHLYFKLGARAQMVLLCWAKNHDICHPYCPCWDYHPATVYLAVNSLQLI